MKVGILGGGQLAKMLSVAAKKLSIDTVCIDAQAEACAREVASLIQVDFGNPAKISECFKSVDCITYETENLPIDMVTTVAKGHTLFPSLEALRVTQDRLLEKNFISNLGIPVADYIEVSTLEDVQLSGDELGYPFILKTRRHGYDGKGQAFIKNNDDAIQAWNNIHSTELIAEKVIPFDRELSLISVRGCHGELRFYPLVLNQHKKGILNVSRAPYLNEALQKQAEAMATRIMLAFDYVGVMTIEFFCVNNELLINEIAPRVHNSGHWTIEGAVTSQFENHMRAICGMPLGSTEPKGYSVMLNIIGQEDNKEALSTLPAVYYHSYGKSPRPGRKLGHVTICAESEKSLNLSLEKVISLLPQ